MRRTIAPSIFGALVALLAMPAAAAPHRDASTATAGGLYFVGDFETCDFSQWPRKSGPPGDFLIVRTRHAQGHCSAALSVNSGADGTWNSRSDAVAMAPPTADYGTDGHTVWQHFSIRFPRNFRSVSGDWNWITEWHNTDGPELPNLGWTVLNRHGVERIAMRILGGPSSSPRRIWVKGPVLTRNHWYDFLVRTTWSPDANDGFVQWRLDGKQLYSRHTATLYRRPDGRISAVYFMQDYYREHTSWTATVGFDGTRLGATRASVRYPNR
jgi:hypothetical protein